MTTRDQARDRVGDERLSALYRATRREMPPSRLDREILDQAARVARHRRRRWLLPLSTAAVILLGTSLTLTLVQPPVPISLPELEEDAFARDTMQKPELAPAAPLKRRQMAAPEASVSERQPQRAAPSGAFDGEPNMVPKEEGLLERRMKTLSPSLQTQASGESVPKHSPAEWIELMLDLHQAGEQDALLEALRDFRADYPDHPLPEALAEIERLQRP